MKIAFVTEDEQTISAHFGSAPKAVIVSIEDGREILREVRERVTHHTHDAHDHDHAAGESHQHMHGAHNPAERFAAVSDCTVLVARGMGFPAYDYAQSLGIEVFVTGITAINEALAAYLAGKLDHDARRLHRH